MRPTEHQLHDMARVATNNDEFMKWLKVLKEQNTRELVDRTDKFEFYRGYTRALIDIYDALEKAPEAAANKRKP